MRRIGWYAAGVALLATALGAAPAREAGRGYDILGDLPVLDVSGRIRPLQTLASEKVKQIYSRETVKLPDREAEKTFKPTFLQSLMGTRPTIKWGPVAAFVDWPARPQFWDEQEFILVEYLPLKRLILTSSVREQLKELAANSPALLGLIEGLGERSELTVDDVRALAKAPGLAAPLRQRIEAVAAALGQDHKWLSPETLETATVSVGGKSVRFTDWLAEVFEKRSGMEDMAGTTKLSTLEDKAAEVGERLFRYMAFRDHNTTRSFPGFDIGIVPRPLNEAYLKFTAAAYEKVLKSEGRGDDLTPLEADVAHTLDNYLKDLQGKHQNLPGRDAKFDAAFKAWLRETAGWVPLRLLLESDEAELTRAGLPAKSLGEFRRAYLAMEESERASPGALPESKAVAVVSAARALGAEGGNYPTVAAMQRESHYNRFSPFFHAPEAYGLGLALLLLSMVFVVGKRWSRDPLIEALSWGRPLFYGLGMAAFIGGIGLEIYGFYLRVRITGWAPVTNMYETVIWVALVVTLLGLVGELITRKTYVAVAASGIALLATILAANVPLLDGNFKTLPPVLRDNFWLAIHVLTIVSSYAAFALALGLGLLAVGHYLTATYRRTVSYRELAAPLVPGLPLAVVGGLGVYGSYAAWSPALLGNSIGFGLVAALAGVGGVLSIVGGYALAGELANRQPKFAVALGISLAALGGAALLLGGLRLGPELLAETTTTWGASIVALVGGSMIVLAELGSLSRASYQSALTETQALAESSVDRSEAAPRGASEFVSAYAAEGSQHGGVATLTRPTVAEIRKREATHRPRQDARGLAMQATAARIKPLTNFIYRTMQVGVLLVAAGTILGGVWADYSWGRFWGWDPKEVWALITLLVYLVPLHGRFAGWVSTFGLVAASVVCFLSVLMAWYGVNFVLGVGLHSYGFTEGGGQGVVTACTLAVLATVGAAAWRRSLSSRSEMAPA
jgi:ABC-type transport system involved in cytochrome c biogenesis permease subunit